MEGDPEKQWNFGTPQDWPKSAEIKTYVFIAAHLVRSISYQYP